MKVYFRADSENVVREVVFGKDGAYPDALEVEMTEGELEEFRAAERRWNTFQTTILQLGVLVENPFNDVPLDVSP